MVLFVMIQSVSRRKAREALKVFQDCGGYEGFFPSDSRYDLHKQIIEQVPNLDVISGLIRFVLKSAQVCAMPYACQSRQGLVCNSGMEEIQNKTGFCCCQKEGQRSI